MLQTVWEQIQSLLGLGLAVGDVGSLQMGLRTVLIYIFTLAIVRLGSKRFLAEASAFDVIVGIMLGSIMSRAINGSAPFLPTLVSGVMLIGIHWLIALIAYYVSWFGPLVKGSPVLLIKDGIIQEQGLRRAGLSRHDLIQATRQAAHETDLEQVKLAYLERSGSISVIPCRPEARVFEISVNEGVQTVRIELD